MLYVYEYERKYMAHTPYSLEKRLPELFCHFLLGFPWGSDRFCKHRIGGSSSIFLFLVRWEERSRNYGDKFDGCIDIENSDKMEVFEMLDW